MDRFSNTSTGGKARKDTGGRPTPATGSRDPIFWIVCFKRIFKSGPAGGLPQQKSVLPGYLIVNPDVPVKFAETDKPPVLKIPYFGRGNGVKFIYSPPLEVNLIE